MHRSRQPLTLWFYAAYLVSTIGPGMSAVQFQRQTGIKNYQTAFMMLHKLRAGMVNEDRTKLNGVVQVDETYVGGEKPGLRGRGAGGKVIVAVAAEMHGGSVSRIRLKVIPDVKGATLTKFVKANAVKGSTIITDDWAGYNLLKQEGYRHIVDASALKNAHRIISNLKTWILGTHHGVSPQHLQAYLNEFMFRSNRKVTPMAAFQTVLGLGSKRVGPTYEGLYGVAKLLKTAWVHPNPKKKTKVKR